MTHDFDEEGGDVEQTGEKLSGFHSPFLFITVEVGCIKQKQPI